MPMKVEFSGQKGDFVLDDVREVSISVDRSPDALGELGSAHHNISVIELKRVSQVAQDDDTTTKLAELLGAKGAQAYFSGTITITRPKEPDRAVRKIEWEKGHICDLDWEMKGDTATDSICIAVTEVTLNDTQFMRNEQK